VSAAVAPLLPQRMIQGGAWCSGRWFSSFSDFMGAFGPTMSSVSIHRYAESVCHGDKATIEGLLADKSAGGEAAGVAGWVALARGVPLFIGEGNSVSCGGAEGVSNVWASALWALDVLFSMAAVGVQRWNFHGMPGGPYAVFSFPDAAAEDVQVRPIFYGLLAFAGAVGQRGVLRNVTTVASTNPFIKCWSVAAAGGATRVVLIHKDMNAAANATVTVVPAAAAAGDAVLVRGLPDAAKGVHSEWNDGISFEGLSYATTVNGRPAGTRASESVPPGSGGEFTLHLPPGSFAMLTLPAPASV
jgi:hypothetical protein